MRKMGFTHIQASKSQEIIFFFFFFFSANGFVETSHSCNYKLESFSLQRQMKESQEEYKQR